MSGFDPPPVFHPLIRPTLSISTHTLTRLLRVLLALAALALVAVWISRFTAPGPVAALPGAPLAAGTPGVDAVLRLFGGGDSGVRRDDPVLTGIFAQRGGRSFVTFRDGADSRFAFVGDEIRPGVWLTAIQPDHVILSERGVERRLTPPAEPATAAVFIPAGPTPADEKDHGR